MSNNMKAIRHKYFLKIKKRGITVGEKGMKRTFLLFSVSFILLIFSVFAVASENAVGLDEIVALALEKNIDLKLAELSLEEAKVEYRKAQLNNLLTNSRLVELQSELYLVQAEENYKNTKNAVILDIINNYLRLISLKQQIETAEKEVELEGNRVEEVEAQVKLGYKSSLELFTQESSYQAAVNALEKLKGDLEQSNREIRYKLALDAGTEIVLIEPVKPEIWTVSEEDISLSASSNTVLDIREQQVEVARGELERARIAGLAELEIRKKELALAKAELELEKERQNQEMKFNNAYHQYNQAVKNMNMAENSLLQAEEHYKIIKEQNEAGFVSNNDLLASELSLYKARDMFTGAIADYYTALIQLQQLLGMELEVDLR